MRCFDEELAELLRFVTRMAEPRPSGATCSMEARPTGVAFPPLKRRIRSLPPDRAAETWLARFRALAGERPDTGDGRVGAGESAGGGQE